MSTSQNLAITSIFICAFLGLNQIATADNSTDLVTVSSASILLNGSFESPKIPQNSNQFGTPASWGWSATPGVIFNGVNGDWPTPRVGQQFVDIGNAPSGSGSLFQSFTITNGGTYKLTWSDAAHVTAPGSLYSVSITDNSSQTIISQNFDAAHGGQWKDRSLLVNLVPGTYTLSFTTESGPAYDTVIDKVALMAAVPVSVGGSVTGISPNRVVCKNLTTGQTVVITDHATSWDCKEAGLLVTPGNIVTQTITGPAK